MRALDENKYFLPPRESTFDCNVITLGIGRDIFAELAMKWRYPQCTFLGIDNDGIESARMYERTLEGKFVEGLIGGYEGTYKASLMSKFILASNVEDY